jgi:hypothetical protein
MEDIAPTQFGTVRPPHSNPGPPTKVLNCRPHVLVLSKGWPRLQTARTFHTRGWEMAVTVAGREARRSASGG